jgi:AcrR family transcriptional regulator
MRATDHTSAAQRPRRRADAERSVARVLDAAVDALARDPEASMAAIARGADVARATIYAHFTTRQSLIDAVTDRAIAEATLAIKAAEPEEGNATDALRRVVASAWRTLGRYHAMVNINRGLPPSELRSRHQPVLATLQPLIERGQRDGSFRSGVPVAWHLSTMIALIHAASDEIYAGRLSEAEAESALIATLVGAVCASDSR